MYLQISAVQKQPFPLLFSLFKGFLMYIQQILCNQILSNKSRIPLGIPLLNLRGVPGVTFKLWGGVPCPGSQGPEVPALGVLVPLLHHVFRHRCFLVNSEKFFIILFLKNPSLDCFCINARSVYCPTTTFCFLKIDVTHIFRLSIFSA